MKTIKTFYLNKLSKEKIQKVNHKLKNKLNKYVIPLTGVPKAGKSLIAGGLNYIYLYNKDKYFIERLAPDMEGVWTFDTGKLDLAREMKNKLKENDEFFDERFLKIKNEHIPNLIKNFDKVIFDLGGIPSKENKKFITNIQKNAMKFNKKFIPVIVSPDEKSAEQWKKFFNINYKINPIVFIPKWNFNKNLKQQAVVQALKLLELINEEN